MKFKRKLYPRGSSYETTIPKQLLFSIEDKKKYHVIFEYHPASKKWLIGIEEIKK